MGLVFATCGVGVIISFFLHIKKKLGLKEARQELRLLQLQSHALHYHRGCCCSKWVIIIRSIEQGHNAAMSVPVSQEGAESNGGRPNPMPKVWPINLITPFDSLVNSRNIFSSYYVPSAKLCTGALAVNTVDMADLALMELVVQEHVSLSLRILQVLNDLLSSNQREKSKTAGLFPSGLSFIFIF